MTNVLTAGLGLKPQHYPDALASTAQGLWFEVHPENYMISGGPRLRWLEAIRAKHPVSLHGVALSLAADCEPDANHLTRLRNLIRRIEPSLVSEHLAWSTWRSTYHPDLFPFPRTRAALLRIAQNVERTQDFLQQRVALENPAHYLRFDGHGLDEIEFLSELVRRTGCGLLIDVNNVYVSARNLEYSADQYIDAFPGGAIMEIHLAGHASDPQLGDRLLIDTHASAISEAVWQLYARLVDRIGPRATLIERDGNLPDFATLCLERERAVDLTPAPVSARAA